MKKMTSYSVAIALLFAFVGFAQDIQVSGTVTSAVDGQPVPGATVQVKDTQTGVQTDFDGKYTISAPQGGTLIFSFLGMKTEEVVIGGGVVDLAMQEDNSKLDEVIVTALGISREKKTLTYAAQEVGGEELTRVKVQNPINSLSGKVAGVRINKSASGGGGAVKVTIRGNSSISSNQPLYVVDGVPLLNVIGEQAVGAFGNGTAGNRDGGDVLSLINPEDIASMTVLKGASAAALYGNEGSNGVILITTKSGKNGKAEVRVSSNTTMDTPLSLYEITKADHINNFYKPGYTQISSVSLTSGNEKLQNYMSYANTSSTGIIPTNALTKNNLNIRETASFFDGKLKANAGISFANQRIHNRPTTGGYYLNPLVGLYQFPTDQKFSDYSGENYQKFDEARNIQTQNWWRNKDTSQNPYWLLNKAASEDTSNRVAIATGLTYKVNDWITFKSRLNYDYISTNYSKKAYAGTQTTTAHANGRYIRKDDVSTQLYADFIASINKDINDDISFNANIGTSLKQSETGNAVNLDSGVQNGLKFTNYFTVANLVSTAGISETIGNKREIQAIFGSLQFGYKKFAYLDITGRNDWSSTLVNSSASSFFYPSVGGTVIISEIADLPEFINFGKVRGSYALVGKELPAFITSPRSTIVNGVLQAPQTGPRPGSPLKPEQQTSIEFGTDWNFLNNKLQFGFTYYQNTTTNQFVRIPAPSTNPFGYTNYGINAGSIENAGYEITIGATPVKTDDFTWNTNLNYASNKSLVKSLPQDLGGKVVLTTAGVNHYQYVLEEGKPFGIIEGKKLVRNDKGQIVLDADGNLQVGEFEDVGNTNPNFTLGWTNSFDYKNFNLNFNIDSRFGGQVMSLTQGGLDSAGVSKAYTDAVADGGVKINAVDASGNAVLRYDAKKYYNVLGADSGRNGASGEYVYDATNIYLREVSLGYKFDTSASSFLKSARVSLVMRNLLFLYKEAPFDPTVSLGAGEGLQGVDIFGLPNSRSMGLNVSLTF